MVATDIPPKVTYTLEERDVFRFMLYHSMHAPYKRPWLRALYALWTLLPTALVLTLDYELTPDDPLFHAMRWIAAAITIPIMAVGGVGFYWTMRALAWLFLKLQARTWSRQTNGLIGRWGVEISPEEVRWRGPSVESVQRWSAFQRIVATPDGILFYQGRDFAQMIPGRAFVSAEASVEFLRLVRAWHAATISPRQGG